MEPITIAAGISAIGSLFGGMMSSQGQSSANALNAQMAREAMQFNAQQAQMNRDWQERMSNTAYQRAMADMKTAGLNPILAYQQGGAGTPGGAQASGTAAHFENAMQGLGQGITSASKGAERAIELQQVAAQTSNQSAQAEVQRETVGLTRANTMKSAQETATNAEIARNYAADTELKIQSSGSPEAMRNQVNSQTALNAANTAFTHAQRLQLEGAGRGKISQELHGVGQVVKNGLNALGEHYKKYMQQPPSTVPSGTADHPLVIDMRK